MSAQERDKERARDDQARREFLSDNAERQRSLFALDALYQMDNQPFSPPTAASGLMHMAIVTEAPRRTAAPNNEHQPIAPKASSSAF